MKIINQLLIIPLTLAAGCAHFTKTATARHELVKYGAAVPPDWRVIVPVNGLALPGAETNGYTEFAFTGETKAGTNVNTSTGAVSSAAGAAALPGWLVNRPRVFVAYRETWTDHSRGGGTFLFTDPAASQLQSGVTNQTALGGAHAFTVGNVGSTITTNSVAALNSVGASVGNIVGTALSAATGGATAAAGSAATSAVKTAAVTSPNLP